MIKTTIKVWDLPLRLFHWLLVITLMVAYLSVKTDWLDASWHLVTGYSVTFLLLFRMIWGLIGYRTARFSQFFPTPARLLRYFRLPWTGIGHTPTAGLSVIAMLCVLTGMMVTGLFANDDISLQGPFAGYISEASSDRMSDWHSLLFNGLLALVALHIAAIVYYRLVKKDNLLVPMITGHKQLEHLTTLVESQLKPAHYGLKLLLSLCLAALIATAMFSPQVHHFMFKPPPAPVVPASQHAW